jgi:hypothetical protein
MKLEYSRQVFEKHSNIKFPENPSSGSRAVPCGGRDRRTDGQTDMTKLIVAFRNFVNAPKNIRRCVHYFAMEISNTRGGTARYSGYSFSCMHLAQRKYSQWQIVKGQRQ